MIFAANFQGIIRAPYNFAVEIVLTWHNIPIQFGILLNDGKPLGTNFRYKQVLEKRLHS